MLYQVIHINIYLNFDRNMYKEEEVTMTMTMYLSIVARVLWFYKDIFIQVLTFHILYLCICQFVNIICVSIKIIV